MRVTNSNRVLPVTQTDKDDFLQLLASLGDRDPTFAEIRAAAPAGKRARLTDGLIHQIALDLGLAVIPD